MAQAMKSVPEWIHTHDDGRGPRRVFVDGVEVKAVFYADTRRGFVNRYSEESFGVHETIHGKVVVLPIERADG